MSIQDDTVPRKAFWARTGLSVIGWGGLAVGFVGHAYAAGWAAAMPPVRVDHGAFPACEAAVPVGRGEEGEVNPKGPFVASKSGKRYYPVDCAAAARISHANLVSFPSEEAAGKAGLTRAASCVFD